MSCSVSWCNRYEQRVYKGFLVCNRHGMLLQAKDAGALDQPADAVGKALMQWQSNYENLLTTFRYTES